MRVLNVEEVAAVSGGEAGVPTSNYYYGDSTAPAGSSFSFLQWLSAYLGEYYFSTP